MSSGTTTHASGTAASDNTSLFLSDERSTTDPAKKRALIDGFADALLANSTISKDVSDLISKYKSIADETDDLNWDTSTKNTLIDGVANSIDLLAKNSVSSGGAKTAGTEAKSGSGEANSDSANAGNNASGDGKAPAVWTNEVKDGQATIRLGDHYVLTLAEKDQSFTITNLYNGTSTRISGDPHVDLGANGSVEWNFKKDMTFVLEDGTKITAHTVANGGDATYTSGLTITNGDQAIQVSGLAGDIDGKNNLKVVQSTQGEALDAVNMDGSETVYEKGNNWVTGGNSVVDQGFIDRSEALYH